MDAQNDDLRRQADIEAARKMSKSHIDSDDDDMEFDDA